MRRLSRKRDIIHFMPRKPRKQSKRGAPRRSGGAPPLLKKYKRPYSYNQKTRRYIDALGHFIPTKIGRLSSRARKLAELSRAETRLTDYIAAEAGSIDMSLTNPYPANELHGLKQLGDVWEYMAKRRTYIKAGFAYDVPEDLEGQWKFINIYMLIYSKSRGESIKVMPVGNRKLAGEMTVDAWRDYAFNKWPGIMADPVWGPLTNWNELKGGDYSLQKVLFFEGATRAAKPVKTDTRSKCKKRNKNLKKRI